MTADVAVKSRQHTARIFGSASAHCAAFYNDALILDMPILTAEQYAPIEAAGRRVLEAHDALDLAAMLGLDAAPCPETSTHLTGATAS